MEGRGQKGKSQFLPPVSGSSGRPARAVVSAQPIRRCSVQVHRGVASASLRRPVEADGWDRKLAVSEDYVLHRRGAEKGKEKAKAQGKNVHAAQQPRPQGQLPAVAPSMVWGRGRGLCDVTARANKELGSVYPLLSPLREQTPQQGGLVPAGPALPSTTSASALETSLATLHNIPSPPSHAMDASATGRVRQGAFDADLDYISKSLRTLHTSALFGNPLRLLDDWRQPPRRVKPTPPSPPSVSYASPESERRWPTTAAATDAWASVVVAIAGGLAGMVTSERVYYSRVLRCEEETLARMILDMRRRHYSMLAAVAAAAAALASSAAETAVPVSAPPAVAAALAAAAISARGAAACRLLAPALDDARDGMHYATEEQTGGGEGGGVTEEVAAVEVGVAESALLWDGARDEVAEDEPAPLHPTAPAGGPARRGSAKRRKNPAAATTARRGGAERSAGAGRARGQSAARKGAGRKTATQRQKLRADRQAARIDEWERIISEMDMATLKLYVASLNGHFGPEHYSALLRLSMEDVVVGPNASQRQIASLKQRVATPSDEAHQCAICMDNFEAGCELAEFPKCSHAFHADCALEYLHEYGKCCPLCKSTLDTPMSSTRSTPLHSSQSARSRAVAVAD
eukprot:TRINITY_DN2777_c1_g1_i1.p1 TRINITY_DN2777_c1_g1~~TRINITY_DN2777_c1_g1_i1.p1  ORF type:complete len:658 (+),score=166.20 TRINITY_DN2777_c1_g1_i1:80-1975(+)